jgi:hypothetical protein
MSIGPVRAQLKRAADLLEAIAQQGAPDTTSLATNSAVAGADYVDMSFGQMGVPGRAWRPDAQATSLRRKAAREAQRIRELLDQLEAKENKSNRT